LPIFHAGDIVMGAVQVVFTTVGTLFVYSMIAAGVFKLFQISADLGEMKDILKDLKRNAEIVPPPAWPLPVPASDESYSTEASVESERQAAR
jgi:hypothetical protein